MAALKGNLKGEPEGEGRKFGWKWRLEVTAEMEELERLTCRDRLVSRPSQRS
jgi:hypothetical protein